VTAPTVDIVLPTRNRPDLTVEAIQSVREQTFTEWNLYVVDDASSDGTADRVERFCARDHRITVVQRTENGGSAAARQTGLVRGTAPYVATIDSDDLWFPEKLERQLACWEATTRTTPDLGVVVCRHEYVDLRTGRQSNALPPSPWSRRWTPFVVYNTSTPVMSRAVLERIGGFRANGSPRLHTTDHVDLFVRLLATSRLAMTREVLVQCRHHDGVRNSDAQGGAEAAAEAAELYERHREQLAAHPRERAWLQAWVAARQLAAGELTPGLTALTAAMRRRGAATGARIVAHYGPFALRCLMRRDGARADADMRFPRR
jgi:glycosyltransferase involved in cell wall biosynthesis